MVKVRKSIKIISRYCKYPLLRLNQGLWVWNLTFLGLNMATKRPNSERWRYQRGYWFTLALLVALKSLFFQRVSHLGHSLTCKSHDFFCPIPVMKGGRSISNCAISGPRRWWSRASLLRRQGDIRGEDAGWTPLDRVGLHDGWHLAPPFCRWAVGQHCPDMAFLHREPGGDRRIRERERERGESDDQVREFSLLRCVVAVMMSVVATEEEGLGSPGRR